ncbi:GNAT family N-acetyltransferase [Halobellus sp. Atlit-31R]|nr:GNAT family N-acetyltransferase [Halobellus sp. Atlit-31R]
MLQPWKLTRNRYGRALYDALEGIGVTATVMYEFARALDGNGRDDSSECVGRGAAGEVAADRRVAVCDGEAVSSLDPPLDEVREGEDVIGVFESDTPCGYLFLSVDDALPIHPLDRVLDFEGAYVRRVFVAPDHRGRGLATALLGEACQRATARGADRATALVAVDNVPSRSLFERCGFEPVRRRQYARVGPLSYRRVVPNGT